MSRDSPSLFPVESSSGWFLQLRGCHRLDGERLPGSAGVRRGGGPQGVLAGAAGRLWPRREKCTHPVLLLFPCLGFPLGSADPVPALGGLAEFKQGAT